MSFKDLMNTMAPKRRKLVASELVGGVAGARVLVVTDAAFFSERTTKGKVMHLEKWVFSEELRDEVLKKYAHVILTVSDNSIEFVRKGFGETDKVTCVQVLPDSVSATTDMLIAKIQEHCSARIVLPKNRRTVSWLNLHRFIDDSHIDFAGIDSHSALGFKIPKEKTFADSVKERSRKGWV